MPEQPTARLARRASRMTWSLVGALPLCGMPAGAMAQSVPASLRACFVCFALLYPIGSFFTIYVRFGSLVRCFALTALLIVVLRHPFAWPELDREETA